MDLKRTTSCWFHTVIILENISRNRIMTSCGNTKHELINHRCEATGQKPRLWLKLRLMTMTT